MEIVCVPAFFLVFFGVLFLAGIHVRGDIIKGVYGGLFLTTIPTFMLLYVVAQSCVVGPGVHDSAVAPSWSVPNSPLDHLHSAHIVRIQLIFVYIALL